MVNTLSNSITRLFDIHVPVKKKVSKIPPTPWITVICIIKLIFNLEIQLGAGFKRRNY